MESSFTLLEIEKISCQCINFHSGQALYYIRKPNKKLNQWYLQVSIPHLQCQFLQYHHPHNCHPLQWPFVF
jgi:hypothetical protein